ncbi:MAG: Zn-dependent oligopeptidase [Polyangiaceae bacterium]|nr:Zn-dependent oligopeptidase [Polyangiaceae bacterium]
MTETQAAPAASATPAATAHPPTWEVDPVAVATSADGLTRLCAAHLDRAAAQRAALRALAAAPDADLTWASVGARLDAMSLEVSMAAGFPELMSVTHPDEAVREAGRGCRPKATEFITDLYLDAEVARVVRRYAARGESLTPVRQRLLADTLRDLRRNGLELPPEGQTRLRSLNDELAKLAQDFETHLSEATLSVEAEPARLRGLPAPWLAAHPPAADGKVRVTTDYPDYFPVLQYAEDRTLARELNALFDSRAAAKNLPILDRVLALRREKAKLLGYPTWAAFALEPRMARTPAAVQEFLAKVAAIVREPARREYAEFQAEYARLGFDAKRPIPAYDRVFLEERLRGKKYGLDSKRLSEWFEVGAVTRGLLTIVEKLYGVELRTVEGEPAWHPDVRVVDVIDGGARIGRIYLDLHPRADKFKHAAMFEIRPGTAGPSGYVTPICALVCNFPRPEPGVPALMTHSDVTTFFHEFGHALHHVLTRQELASYSGTNTARDFVEAPSQMFEEWTYRRETLDLFARHHQRGEPLPEDLYHALVRARSFGRALGTERQLALATLDFEYHVREPPFDTDRVLDEVMKRAQSFALQPGTHFQATFGHLMGYDAGYYGYQWALALARDVLGRFEREGFLNPRTASDWRRAVLAQGAGADERALVTEFLGREPNLDAYAAYLSGK